MLSKKELANKLINNEEIKAYYPEWENFKSLKGEAMTVEEAIKRSLILYEDWILWKYANGETKEEIKEFLIGTFNMISNYKEVDNYSKSILEAIVDLLNKYFAIQPTETHIGILNGQKVIYTWNKLLNYKLVNEEITNNKYYPYRLKVELKDWINHKVSGKNIGKFSVDHLGNIINIHQ